MSKNFWNPWHGCMKCSPGCLNCYMYALDDMRGISEWSSVVKRTKEFDYPIKKDRKGQYKVKSGEYLKVNMTSDTFIEDADEWRNEFWDIIRQRPDVKFWILTKRPERIMKCLPEDWVDGWENVMLNITCENWDMFKIRWDVFKNVPAKHKGLCLAPLISHIDIRPALKSGQIEEVQVGGENYNNPRPCNQDWVESLSWQCEQYNVNFFWYESGTRLLVNGVEYQYPYKKQQAAVAFNSGLSRWYGQKEWKLYDPDDGHLLSNVELFDRKFNKFSCVTCSQVEICNGCSNCGKCRNTELIGLNELYKLRNGGN